jgi:hypothetical protein
LDVEDMPAWARALLDGQVALREDIARLAARLVVQAAGEEGDAAVGQAIAARGLHQPFSCREILALSSADPVLRQALAAALIDDGAQLGRLFDRLRRRGLINRSEKRGSHGWRWQL